MQITGTAHMFAPIPVAWDAFHDPGVLTRTIPGLQSLEEVGEDAYKATVSAGVASIRGTYAGTVALTEQIRHESFLLRASGQGGPGTISADVRVRLTEADDGGTDIVWGADASVGGPIGGVGQRMLQGVARKMATQFFAAIDQDITTGGAQGPHNPDAHVEAAPTHAGADSTGSATRGAHRPHAPTPPPAKPGASSTSVLGAALIGALIALLGVLVGILAGRK